MITTEQLEACREYLAAKGVAEAMAEQWGNALLSLQACA